MRPASWMGLRRLTHRPDSFTSGGRYFGTYFRQGVTKAAKMHRTTLKYVLVEIRMLLKTSSFIIRDNEVNTASMQPFLHQIQNMKLRISQQQNMQRFYM